MRVAARAGLDSFLIAELLGVTIDDEDIGLATHQQSLTSRVRTRDTETLQAINERLKKE